ncbi:MAG: hypothetical protein LBU32_18145 [Clostridiales bacterium]|jgi:putative ABC transport system permease protein|nr:hypothetical protein [Clostridiales bacterium]
MLVGWAISRFIAVFLYQIGTLQYTLEETAVAFFNIEYLLAVVCVAVVTCGAAFLSCRKSLKSTAATLMRPKPPAQGHRILLERFTPFWRRLSFSGKIVTRNLFRNRARMVMGLVGIIGSTALILCGFGMRDSMNGMLDKTLNSAMRSDA